MSKFFKDSLNRTCCIFTVCVFFFYFIGYYASAAKQPAMAAEMIVALFFASLCFSFSSFFLHIKKLPKPLGYAFHCTCCVIAVFLLYVNVLGKGGTAAGKMVCIVLTTVAYAVTMFVRAVIINAIKARKDEE